MTFFEAKDITKNFGGLTAVNSVSFGIRMGEIVGLIGPNGAGKTTMFNLISGVLTPDEGRIEFKGDAIAGLNPDAVTKRGIVRTFQANLLFSGMTSINNIILGHHLRSGIGFWGSFFNSAATRKKERLAVVEAQEILEFMGLKGLENEIAGQLPHGHQRLLGIAIALSTQPDLLLLDEPTAGLNRQETEAVVDRIWRIRDKGSAVLLVEHDMRMIMSICERIVVLNFGRKIAEGAPEEIKSNLEVIEAYLGTDETA